MGGGHLSRDPARRLQAILRIQIGILARCVHDRHHAAEVLQPCPNGSSLICSGQAPQVPPGTRRQQCMPQICHSRAQAGQGLEQGSGGKRVSWDLPEDMGPYFWDDRERKIKDDVVRLLCG